MSHIIFDVIMRDDRWQDVGLDISALAVRAVSVLPQGIMPQRDQEASLVLMDDAAVQGLNRDYRNKDKPTNILSFPTVNAPTLLGDIVLARQTIMTEAQSAGKPLQDHIMHLIIHGVLHLLGYDHIVSSEAEVMEAIEIEMLGKLGIANPYVLQA